MEAALERGRSHIGRHLHTVELFELLHCIATIVVSRHSGHTASARLHLHSSDSATSATDNTAFPFSQTMRCALLEPDLNALWDRISLDDTVDAQLLSGLGMAQSVL